MKFNQQQRYWGQRIRAIFPYNYSLISTRYIWGNLVCFDTWIFFIFPSFHLTKIKYWEGLVGCIGYFFPHFQEKKVKADFFFLSSVRNQRYCPLICLMELQYLCPSNHWALYSQFPLCMWEAAVVHPSQNTQNITKFYQAFGFAC